MLQVKITGGFLKGKKLQVPPLSITRPTMDRVKEDLFNILQNSLCINLSQITVLDAFAGSGALGIESISRGAQQAVFVEQSKSALQVLDNNINSCSLNKQCIIYPTILENLPKCPHGSPQLVFLDPPFDQGKKIANTLQSLRQKQWLDEKTIVYFEQTNLENYLEYIPNINLLKNKSYDHVKISLFKLS